jgi:hypothetical protein
LDSEKEFAVQIVALPTLDCRLVVTNTGDDFAAAARLHTAAAVAMIACILIVSGRSFAPDFQRADAAAASA